MTRPARDRLGEALRRVSLPGLRPLWPNMVEVDRERWREAGDILTRICAQLGLRIVADDDGLPR